MDRKKFKSLVHLICSRCQDNPSRLGAVKLNKVVWYIETNYYVGTGGKSLTGVRFTKQKNGPVAAAMVPVIKELVDEGALVVNDVSYYSFSKKEYITKKQPNLSLFTADEIQLIDRMIDAVCDLHTAASISDATHTESWEIAEMGETIPLFAIMAKPRRITDADRAWADAVIASRPN